MCRLFPTFHAERPSLFSLNASRCHLSVIKWCRPFFGTVPCRPPHSSFITQQPAGQKQKVFWVTANDDSLSVPSAHNVLNHVELEPFNSIARRWMLRPVSFISLGYIQTRDKKREREKPELNGLLAFLKIFHGFAVAFFLIHARLCVRVYTSPESADLNGRCCVYNKYTKSILYIAGRFSIQLNIFLASQIRKSDENNVTT